MGGLGTRVAVGLDRHADIGDLIDMANQPGRDCFADPMSLGAAHIRIHEDPRIGKRIVSAHRAGAQAPHRAHARHGRGLTAHDLQALVAQPRGHQFGKTLPSVAVECKVARLTAAVCRFHAAGASPCAVVHPLCICAATRARRVAEDNNVSPGPPSVACARRIGAALVRTVWPGRYSPAAFSAGYSPRPGPPFFSASRP